MLRPPSSVRRAPGRRRGCRWLGHDRFLTRGGRRRGRGRRAAGGDSKGTNCQGRRQKDEVFHSWFGWLQPPFGGQRVNSRIERKLFAISPLGFFQSETCTPEFFQGGAFAFSFQNAPFECSRPRGILSPHFLTLRLLGGAALALPLIDRCAQTLARQFAIHRLRPRVLHRHTEPAGPMPQGDSGGNFVHVLPSRPARACERFLQIGFA